MRKLVLGLMLFFVLGGAAQGATPYTIDNCTFTVTSTINLTTSNTSCETPGGSTTWTEETNGCALTWQANSADYAFPSASNTDCNEFVYAPVNPAGRKVTAQVDFIDSGTLGTGDANDLWCGTDYDNMYKVHTWDDTGHNYELWKVSGGSWTFLTSGGQFANTNTDTIQMIISPTSVIVKENGSTIITQTTSLGAFEITKCGIGCGGGQFNSDDCSTAFRMDNFSVQVERGDTTIIN